MTDNSISRKVKDISAGFVGGATQVLIGQPFDLMKVRLQTSNNSLGKIFTDVVKHEGVAAFYKGTLPPLFGVGVCVSLQFYGFHETKRYFESRHGADIKPLSPSEIYISGAMAGIVNTPIASPVEQLRILSQSSHEKIQVSHLVKNIYSQHGFAALFRGINITLLREIQSYGVWFLSYETIIQSLVKWRNLPSRNELTTSELLFSGALSGNLLWLSAYPLDVIKSNIQSDSFLLSKFNGSTINATKYIFHHYGIRGFWKGIGPCLIRATPCSAGTFASVELALRVLG